MTRLLLFPMGACWLRTMPIFFVSMPKERSTQASLIASWARLTFGELLRSLVLIYDLLSVEEMENRIEFL